MTLRSIVTQSETAMQQGKAHTCRRCKHVGADMYYTERRYFEGEHTNCLPRGYYCNDAIACTARYAEIVKAGFEKRRAEAERLKAAQEAELQRSYASFKSAEEGYDRG